MARKIVISDEFKAKAQAARALRAKARAGAPATDAKFKSRTSSNWDTKRHGLMTDDLPNAGIIKHNPNYVQKVNPNPHGVDDLENAMIMRPKRKR